VDANGERVAYGGWALYFAAQRLNDERWRYQSLWRLARFYGDLGWKGPNTEVHLVADHNFFGVIGPNRLPGLGGLLLANTANRKSWAMGKDARNAAGGSF
jgi:hypothetical protein